MSVRSAASIRLQLTLCLCAVRHAVVYGSVTSSPVSGDVQLVELRFQPPIILNRLAAAAKTAGDSQIETD